jgi:hypothetical protein
MRTNADPFTNTGYRSRADTGTETRETAADTLKAASSALSPHKVGLGQKLALAGTIYRLARRYPVPALVVGGLALAFYLGRRNAQARVSRY